MSELDEREHLVRFVQELLDLYGEGRTLDAVLIVELSGRALLPRGEERLTIGRDAMQTVAEYQPRFATLCSAGYSWINVSYYGHLGESALVVVELPSQAAAEPTGSSPSINYSGPQRRVVDAAGDARVLVDIERVEEGEGPR